MILVRKPVPTFRDHAVASRDDVQGAKNQASNDCGSYMNSKSWPLPAWRSFPRHRRRNPRMMSTSCSGVLLAGTKNLCHQTASTQVRHALIVVDRPVDAVRVLSQLGDLPAARALLALQLTGDAPHLPPQRAP